MKVFVTGGTGFIGSYLVKWLISEGHEVMCLRRPTSSLHLLKDYSNQIKWVCTDSDWKNELRTFHPYIIFNLAWDGVSASERIIWDKQLSNIMLQQELLDIAATTGCKSFVGIGSQSEYGDFDFCITENHQVKPKTAYAAAKIAALDVLRTFCEINDINWFWFRLFPVFGPGESDKWLIPSLIKNMMTSDSMDLTKGEQKLPYLYVEECAKAIGHAMYATGFSGVYNVCADNPKPLREIVESIRDFVNPKFKLNFGALPYRYGQSMFMEGDTTELCNKIYVLKTSDFEEKLHQTINHYIQKYANDIN